ncbi:hypothetical protein FRC14_000955 [Serendipita sp. 396]|nr:hypothetical protein FRC14_000955 [Serendipita sp. 396]
MLRWTHQSARLLRHKYIHYILTRGGKAQLFTQARSSSSSETSFGRSWIIWAPLFSASAVFIAAVTAAESRPIRHHIPQSANSKDENASQPAEDEWAKPLTSFFGLDEPAEEGDRRSDSNAPSAGLGWKGLNFIRESLSVDSIPSLTASWIWPESIANMQAQIQALIVAIGRGPGSLYEQIIEETSKSPEASWDAHVRLGDDLCVAERAFLRERKRRMRHTFAEFIGVNEKEVKEEDIPIIAIAASGGGYRAMTNTTGSLVGAKESGLLDCIAYMAGISGSCWALGVLYSGLPSIASLPDPQLAAEHIKDRVSKTFFDTVTMELLTTAPTHKYLLSGLLLKATAPLGSVSLTDIYGTLISSRLFVPSDISKLDPDNLSLHKFRRFIDDGSMPLPIFTAIQHEIPHDAEKHLAEVQEQRDYLVDETRYKMLKREEEDIERKTRWLWYEFTPYEVGCDELGAWIPSWSFGRQFENGQSIERRPELSFTILAGIYASAFCATLKDYFQEAQPILRQLPWTLYSWIAGVIEENREDFGAIHPVVPNQLPNFVKGLEGQLREGSPKDITFRETLGFMDAGAELNIPYYPLLRRDVDCIIALDASADSQDLWFTRAEEYATRRGISTWPKGARWPVELNAQQSSTPSPPASTGGNGGQDDADPNRRLAESQESQVKEQTERQKESESRPIPDRPNTSQAEITPTLPHETVDEPRGSPDSMSNEGDGVDQRSLQACSIWIGSSKSSEADQSRFEDLTEEELAERDGIGIVYMPLIPNEKVAPGWDPSGISTWRREMDLEETQRLLDVAKANMLEGDEKIRKLLKAMWIRKRRAREETQHRHRLRVLESRVQHALDLLH